MLNLKFKSLDVEGFQSIGKASIGFKNLGTCLITGKNLSDNKTKSNGSGKSSLIISLIWCLFGSTPNGIKNEVVNSYYKQGCSVLVDFDVDDINYKVRRSIKHKEYKTGLIILKNDEDVSAKNKKDSNDVIKDILNIDKELFLQLIFLSQGFGNRFTLYTPKARKELLESLYNINDELDTFVEKIKIKESEFKNIDNNLKENKLTLMSGIASSKENICRFGEKIVEANNNIEKIKENNTQITEDEIASYINDLNELNSQRNDFMDKGTKLQLKINNIKNEINQYNQQKNDINFKIEKLKNNQKSNICPTCGQLIINAEEHNHKILEEIQNLNIELNNIFDLINNSSTKISKLNDKEISINDIIKAIDNNIYNLTSVYNTKQKQYNEQLSKEANIKSLTESISSYNQIINHDNEVINENNDKLTLLSKDLELNEENLNITTQLIRFAGNQFKSYLLDDIIQQLNGELEELSKSLFESRIIKITGDNKLDVMLDDKYYEQLSGGEQNKVNIGIIIAQRKLAQKMNSISSNILVCDEIFDGLDDVSFNIVLDLLSDEMQDVEDNIIISHRNIEEIPFDHRIEVIKNKDNVSVVSLF